MGNMFADIDERIEETGLAIDADSLLFKACYKYKEDFNIELAYMEFCKRVGNIERACYDEVQRLNEVVLCFSTKKSFRNQIFDAYKANRVKNQKEESVILRKHSRELKLLAVERLKPMVKASNIWEADDLVVQYADKGYLTSAFDKDVLNATKTKCFNYDTNQWNSELSQTDIDRWYIYQSIMGDGNDGIKGVKGMGKVKAEEFVSDLFNGDKTADDYVELFETPEHCLQTNRLVRMNQYKDGKLKLCTMEDILNSIYPF